MSNDVSVLEEGLGDDLHGECGKLGESELVQVKCKEIPVSVIDSEANSSGVGACGLEIRIDGQKIERSS